MTRTVTAHSDDAVLGGFSCYSSDVSATVNDAGTAGYVDALGFAGCDWGGLDMDVTLGGLPWSFFVTSQTSTLTHATVSGVSLHISGLGCSVDVTGTVSGVYDSSTHVFTVGPSNLVASNASCLGLINDGDVIPFEGTYTIFP